MLSAWGTLSRFSLPLELGPACILRTYPPTHLKCSGSSGNLRPELSRSRPQLPPTCGFTQLLCLALGEAATALGPAQRADRAPDSLCAGSGHRGARWAHLPRGLR